MPSSLEMPIHLHLVVSIEVPIFLSVEAFVPQFTSLTVKVGHMQYSATSTQGESSALTVFGKFMPEYTATVQFSSLL